MIVRKNLSLKDIYNFSGQHLTWLLPWMLIVSASYYFTHWKFITIPWLPLSLVGTAVAFYLGFKNNQAYDRNWEARKIWGAIVNDSRKFASMIKHLHSEGNIPDENESLLRKKIIFRHIAWLYQLRTQLLNPTKWEHVSLKGIYGFYNQKRRDAIFKDFAEELDELNHQHYLSENEKKALENFNNKATQLLDLQTDSIQQLFKNGKINMMQQADLQNVVSSLYDEQGKAERIKNFPFPRNYASHGFVFTCIFIFLLPFGIVGEMAKLGDAMIWMTIPLGVLVGWIYVVMELIGDYSENPFEGLRYDIPMLSICRTIEIDLLQMFGETEIPKPVQPKNGVIM